MADATSVVNVVIRAVDNASQQIKPVVVAFADLGTNAQSAASKVANELTASVTNFSQKSRGAVEPVAQGFIKINNSAAQTAGIMLTLGSAIATGFGTAFKAIDQLDRALRVTLGAGVKDLFNETVNSIVADISNASQYSATEILSAFTNFKPPPIDLGEAVLEAENASKQIQQSFGAIQLASLETKAKGVGDRIVSTFDGVKGRISTTFDSAFQGVQGRLAGVFDRIGFDALTGKAKSAVDRAIGVFQQISPSLQGLLERIQLDALITKAKTTSEQIVAAFQSVPGRISALLQNSNLNGLVGAGRRTIDFLVSLFQQAKGKIAEALGSPRLEPLIQTARSASERLVSVFRQVRGRISETLQEVNFEPLVQKARTISERVITFFQGVKNRVSEAFGAVDFKGLLGKAQDAGVKTLSGFKPSVAVLPAGNDDSYQKSVAIAATASAQIVSTFESAAEKIPAAFEQSISFDAPVAAAKAASNKIAENFQSAAGRALNSLDRVFSQIPKIQQSIGSFANIGQQVSGAVLGFAGGSDTLQLFNGIKNGVGSAVEAISSGAQQIFYFTQAIDILKSAVVGGPYELLIGQNVRLREQLLATQSTLAATNKVIVGGQQVKDPTVAIQALSGPVEGAISKIRKGSLELVNVTSSQLIESFQIVAGEAANIGANLDQAAKLTLSFGATLGTLGVPLFQARQEIQSILQGSIDQNSIVAKSLGITNEQVGIWKQQGTLVDNLLKKMEAFKAGNKLAAETFGGYASNIQELVENIGLEAGKGLLEPLVGQLKAFYTFLDQNKEGISTFVSGLATSFAGALVNITQGVGAIFSTSQGAVVKTITLLFQALITVLNGLGDALKVAAVVAEPFIKIIEQLIGLRALISPIATLAIQFGVLATVTKVVVSSFNLFANSIPLVGEGLLLMQLRGSGVIGLFTGLSQSAGVGAAGLLTLGVNLQRFPFLFNAVASRIPIFGTQIAGLIPTLSATGVAVLSLGKKFPGISEAVLKAGSALASTKALGGTGFETIAKGLSGLFDGKAGSGIQTITQGISELASNSKLLQPLAPTLKNIAFNTDLAAIANQKLAEAAALARASVVKMILNFSAIALVVTAAVFAINEFLIKNEANRKILVAIGEAIKAFGEKVYQFFTSPLGIALTAITGVTIAIRTGLVASTLEAAKAFAQLAATNTPKWIGEVYKGVESLSSVLRGDFSKLGNIFGEGGEKAKAEAEQIKNAIAGLDAQSLRQQNLAAKGVTLKSSVDPAAIAQQKAALQQSLEGLSQAGAGNKLFDGINSGLEKFKALAKTDVKDAVGAVAASIESLPARGRAAGAALASGFNVAKGAVLGFLAATGPVLALTAAIYIASEAFNTLTKINDAATASTKRYKESVEEAILKVQKLEELRRAAAGQPAPTGQKTTQDLQKERVGKIKEGQNFFEQTVESLPIVNEIGTAAGGGLLATAQLKNEEKAFTGTLEEAKKNYESFAKGRLNTQSELETNLAKLQKQRAEAGAEDKDTTKIDNEIKATQERIKGEKDALQASIDAISKEQPLNEQQVKDKDELLKKLVELQGQYEKLGQVAVGAIDLPRLGSATEQFQADINSGLQALSKGTGNKEQVEAKLKASIQGIQELQKSGAITDEQAQAFYSQIASSALVSKELQVQAQQGITQSFQEELKKRNEGIEADQAEIKGQLAQGVLTQEESDKQITAKKIEQYQVQLDALRAQIAEENRLRADQLQGTLATLDQQIGEAQTRLSKAPSGSDEAKAAQGEIESLRAKRADAQTTYENAVKESNRRLVNEERKTASQIAEEQAVAEDRRIERDRKKASDEAKNRELTKDVNLQRKVNSGSIKPSEADVQTAQAAKQSADEEIKIEKQKLDELLKNPKRNEDAIRESRNRVLELTKQSLSAEKGLYDAQNRQLEVVQKKAVDVAKKAETEREIEIQRLVNKGAIDKSDADERRVQGTRSRLQAELKAEQDKQKELEKSPRRNEDAIRESKLKTLDITKQILQNEEQAYEAHIAKIKDKLQQQETSKLIAIQKRVNAGQLKEEDADTERATLTVQRLEREIQLETRNKSRKLQLELQLEEAKRALQNKTAKSEDTAIKNRALAVSNAFEAEVQALERQKLLYDALNRALEMRVQLLNAAKEVGNAGANFITGQLDALAKTEKSERTKRELAQITALIKLEALRQEQKIAQVTLEIEIQKNRLALERKDIENQIAIAKQKGDIAQKDADVKLAEAQFKRGEVSKEEVDAKKIQAEASRAQLGGLIQERGLIGKERATQPFLEAAQRQNLDLQQRAATTQAKVGLFESLSPAEQRQQRKGFQESLLSEIFGGDFKSAKELVAGLKTGNNGALTKANITDELSGKGRSSGILDYAKVDNPALKLPELKKDADRTALSLYGKDFTVDDRKTRAQIDDFRKSNAAIKGSEISLSKASIEAIKSSGKIQPNIRVTVNANSKDVGSRTASEVRSALDKVLKLAK